MKEAHGLSHSSCNLQSSYPIQRGQAICSVDRFLVQCICQVPLWHILVSQKFLIILGQMPQQWNNPHMRVPRIEVQFTCMFVHTL
uniref:WPK1 n=1 Tax=Arundo donax TaxID=35708 RepID=A0A0A9CZ01_ARUDO